MWGNGLQKQGGFMVVGAGEIPDHHTLPIQAATASTP
ncbi:hypothetical protein X011_21500 [Mycobacterium tuberculosis variant microti OV254]|nr:hypothetical protein X011_21500 [Mycobacterium tuberculosis variant microti OV254]